MGGSPSIIEAILKVGQFLSTPGNALSVVSLLVALLSFLFYFRASYQLRRFRLLHQRLWEEVDAPGLEAWVQRLDGRLGQLAERLRELKESVGELARGQERCIQKVGMVRYNAFEDVGGELSFSLALLDAHNDGVVLSGLYSREESRIYAKPIEEGKSAINLSEEEREALRKATRRSKD